MRFTLFAAAFTASVLAALSPAHASSSTGFFAYTVDTVVKIENSNSGGGGVGLSSKTTTPGGIGISGLATGAGATVGVRGYSKSSTGFGVHGTNDGGGKGVYGISTNAGHGVYGEATATSGIGVEGRATNVNGFYGVRGVGPSIGVYGTTLNSTGEGVRGKSVDSVGVMAISTNGNALRATTVSGVGVYGTSTNGIGVNGEGGLYGVHGKVGTFGSYGVFGEADLGYGVLGTSIRGYGVMAQGSGGVYGSAYYNGNGDPVGVTGHASGGAVAYGIVAGAEGGYYGNWAGWFDGNVAITGECSPCVISDVTTKKNIKPLTGSLAKVLTMKPKSYEMRNAEFDGKMVLAQGPQNGLIAQDLELVVPEVVHRVTAPPHYTEDELRRGVKREGTELKAVNYTELIPILVAAIQEQQAQIEALQQLVKAGR